MNRRPIVLRSSDERAVAGSPLPNIPSRNAQQRRIHKREDELQHVHDLLNRVVTYAAPPRSRCQHIAIGPSKVMLITRTALDVRLVNVVRPNCIESRDVARHAGHETCHQRGQTTPNMPLESNGQHHRDRHVVFKGASVFR